MLRVLLLLLMLMVYVHMGMRRITSLSVRMGVVHTSTAPLSATIKMWRDTTRALLTTYARTSMFVIVIVFILLNWHVSGTVAGVSKMSMRLKSTKTRAKVVSTMIHCASEQSQKQNEEGTYYSVGCIVSKCNP